MMLTRLTLSISILMSVWIYLEGWSAVKNTQWRAPMKVGSIGFGFEGAEIGLMDGYNIIMLLILSIASLAISQLLWIKAAGSLGILFASLHMNAVPFYVMVVMVIFFDASWSWVQALGALLVGVGVIYSQMLL